MDPFEISRPDRSTLQFSNADDVERFLDREQEFWKWLDDERKPLHPTLNNQDNHYRSDWIPGCRAALQASDNSGVVSLLNGRYVTRKLLVATDSEAQAIRELAKTDSRLARTTLILLSAGNLQDVFNNKNFWQTPMNFRAMSHAFTISANLDDANVAGAVASLQEVRRELEATHTDLRSVITGYQDTAAQETIRIAEAAKESERIRSQNFSQTEAVRDQTFQTLHKKLSDTDDFYSKQMEVQGAVRYWSARAQQYRKTAIITLICLVLFSLGAPAVLYWLYSQAADRLPAALSPTDSIPLAAIFKAAAFGILMTTILFWIGRVMLRLYLSDRHLAADAEERRTMVMTYLALARNKKVNDDDKKLIFPAIFRAGADGIVKDENSPDTAFAALVASIMKR